MDAVGGIYMVVCKKNNKTLIGSTKDFVQREKSYWSNFGRNKGNKHARKDYAKYGADTFVFVPFYPMVCTAPPQLKKEEQWFFEHFATHYETGGGYNIRSNANNNGSTQRKVTPSDKQGIVDVYSFLCGVYGSSKTSRQIANEIVEFAPIDISWNTIRHYCGGKASKVKANGEMAWHYSDYKQWHYMKERGMSIKKIADELCVPPAVITTGIVEYKAHRLISRR